MSNEQETPKSNGKLSSILNDGIPTPANVTSRQETSQNNNNNKEPNSTTTTTTNGSGKTSPKIKKTQTTKETSSKSDTTSKNTNKAATKSSKQTKTSTSKAKTNPRKRPLSPSDSEGGRETSQELERCKHPKHDEYMKNKPPPVVVNKKAKHDKPPKLVGMPKRLEGVLNIDRGTKMCSRCINQTDKDPQYTSQKKYVSRQSVYKKNERSRLTIDMAGK